MAASSATSAAHNDLAQQLLTVALREHISPKQLGAMVAAMMRADYHHDVEVSARLDAIAPVVAARVQGNSTSGATRAKRNIAEHNFSLGVPFGEVSASQAKKLQRGGQPRPRKGLATPIAE